MSKYWDVYCKDCQVSLGVENANHEHELMRDLVRNRHGLAAMAPILNDIGSVRLNHWSSSISGIDPGWFAKHHEHKLVPMSEYGDVLDDVCENKNCGARGDLRRLVVNQKSWLLCDECCVVAIDVVSAAFEKPEPRR